MYLCALFVMIFTTSCWGDSVKQIQTTSNLDRASEGVAAMSQIESRDSAINVTGGSIYKVLFSTRVSPILLAFTSAADVNILSSNTSVPSKFPFVETTLASRQASTRITGTKSAMSQQSLPRDLATSINITIETFTSVPVGLNSRSFATPGFSSFLPITKSTSVLLASSTLGDVPTNVDSSFEAYSSSVSTYYNTTLSSRVHSGVVLSSKIISTLTQQTSKIHETQLAVQSSVSVTPLAPIKQRRYISIVVGFSLAGGFLLFALISTVGVILWKCYKVYRRKNNFTYTTNNPFQVTVRRYKEETAMLRSDSLISDFQRRQSLKSLRSVRSEGPDDGLVIENPFISTPV